MSRTNTNPFLIQQIRKYTTEYQTYLTTPDVDDISPMNDFKQQLLLTRNTFQPGAANYQFDASPYSFYTSTYTPLTHTNNINSMGLDALRPTVISTAIQQQGNGNHHITVGTSNNDNDDLIMSNNTTLVNALPSAHKHPQLLSRLKSAFALDSDGKPRLTAAERKQKYLDEFGEEDGYYFDDGNNNDEVIINVDDEFEDNYIDHGDDDDGGGNNNDINDPNQQQHDNQGVKKNTRNHVMLMKTSRGATINKNQNIGKKLQSAMFSDVLDNLFGTRATTNNEKNNNNNTNMNDNQNIKTPIDAAAQFALEKSRTNPNSLMMATNDGIIMTDDFDAINNDLFAIDSTTIDLFSSNPFSTNNNTSMDPMNPTKRKAMGDLSGDLVPSRPPQPGFSSNKNNNDDLFNIGLMDGLNSTNDLFDIELSNTLDGGSGFDINNFLSGAMIVKSEGELRLEKQRLKEQQKEKEYQQMYKEQGILSPQEEQEQRRKRILGLK